MIDTLSRVVVVGAGYVGLPLAASLAAGDLGRPCRVTLLDRNPDRLAFDIRDGKLQALDDAAAWVFDEPGLAQLLEFVIVSGVLNIRAYDPEVEDLTDILGRLDAERVYVCVGTPGHASNEIDTSAVEAVGIAVLETDSAALVIRSTITPDTILRLDNAYRLGHDADIPPERLAVVPEFLREGHVIADLRRPSRLVIGCDDEDLTHEVHSDLLPAVSAPVLVVTPREAPLVKLGANAALAVRALLATTLASMVEQVPGAHFPRVLEAITAGEERLAGLATATPGLGAWGPCLPKDSATAAVLSARAPLLAAVRPGSTYRVQQVAQQVLTALHGRSGRVRILVVGVGFKPDSADWRTGPLVELLTAIRDLSAWGGLIPEFILWDDRVPDPMAAVGSFGFEVDDCRSISVCTDLGTLGAVHATVLLRRLPDSARVVSNCVVDPYAFLDLPTVRDLIANGVRYKGAGRPEGWGVDETGGSAGT